MSLARIAGRYAKSLMDLPVEQGKLETVKDDMLSFACLRGSSMISRWDFLTLY